MSNLFGPPGYTGYGLTMFSPSAGLDSMAKGILDLCDNEDFCFIAGLVRDIACDTVKSIGSAIFYVPSLLLRTTLRAVGIELTRPLPAVSSTTRGAIEGATRRRVGNVDVELGPVAEGAASSPAKAEEEWTPPPEPPPKTIEEIEAMPEEDRSIAEMKRLQAHRLAKVAHEEQLARWALDDPETLSIAELKRRGW